MLLLYLLILHRLRLLIRIVDKSMRPLYHVRAFLLFYLLFDEYVVALLLAWSRHQAWMSLLSIRLYGVVRTEEHFLCIGLYVFLCMTHLVIRTVIYDVALGYDVLACGAEHSWTLTHVHHHVRRRRSLGRSASRVILRNLVDFVNIYDLV